MKDAFESLPSSIGRRTELDRRESIQKLTDLAQAYRDFQVLNKKWSNLIAENYLAIFRNTAGIELMRSFTVPGLLVLYHEKKEIDVLESILDDHHNQKGFVADSLARNSLRSIDIFIFVRGSRAQSSAHRVAISAEMDFLEYLAKGLGCTATYDALIVTHPRLLRNCAKDGGDMSNVPIAISEMESSLAPVLPKKEDIENARRFWEQQGVIYSRREKALLDGAVIKSLEEED